MSSEMFSGGLPHRMILLICFTSASFRNHRCSMGRAAWGTLIARVDGVCVHYSIVSAWLLSRVFWLAEAGGSGQWQETLDPHRPRAIRLHAGEGSGLSRRMDELVEAARREIPRAFESEDYERRTNEVTSELQERLQALYGQVQEEAARMGLALTVTPPARSWWWRGPRGAGSSGGRRSRLR